MEIARTRPETHHTVADREEAFVAGGIAEIGKGGENPLEALPLVIDLTCGASFAELRATREERAHPRRCANLSRSGRMARDRGFSQRTRTRVFHRIEGSADFRRAPTTPSRTS